VVSLPAPCLLMPDPNGMAVQPVVIEVFFFFLRRRVNSTGWNY
jgi:hypothetical protein